MKTFLILSDIHASGVDPASPKAPSYVSSANSSVARRTDPISELESLCAREGIRPDYVLCAGDITDRSDPNALKYAWERLNQLADTLSAKLIATVGNHDLDSRYNSNKYDPRGYAMSLTPTIPLGSRSAYLEYWAENFTVFEGDGCNILVINTAAYHGGGKEALVEMEHGRISELTIQAIRARLKSLPHAPVNLTLCHHHPIGMEPTDTEYAGLTRGGEGLLEALEETDAPWVVVHGHKHRPELFYALGSGNSPVLLSAASFSFQVNADAQNKNPNQVHLLVCDPDGAAANELTSAGHVKSWTWQLGAGWKAAHGEHGLPHIAGFGFRGNARVLASDLETHLAQSESKILTWQAAKDAIPKLNFLSPKDFDRFERALTDLGLKILSDRDGSLAQVGRRQ